MTQLAETEIAATGLAEECAGFVHLPGTPEYDAGRFAWNVAVNQRPWSLMANRSSQLLLRTRPERPPKPSDGLVSVSPPRQVKAPNPVVEVKLLNVVIGDAST